MQLGQLHVVPAVAGPQEARKLQVHSLCITRKHLTRVYLHCCQIADRLMMMLMPFICSCRNNKKPTVIYPFRTRSLSRCSDSCAAACLCEVLNVDYLQADNVVVGSLLEVILAQKVLHTHVREGLRYGRKDGWRNGWIGGQREKVREVYGFSSLVKQNKKGKKYAVFCFAGKRK